MSRKYEGRIHDYATAGVSTAGTREVVASGPRSHFVNDEKIIYTTYEKIFDLVEYNISRNNHIA